MNGLQKPRRSNTKPSAIYTRIAAKPATLQNASTPPRGLTQHKSPHCSKPISHSDITSKLDGTSLGEMLTAWKDAAASEVRVNMLDTLIRKK